MYKENWIQLLSAHEDTIALLYRIKVRVSGPVEYTPPICNVTDDLGSVKLMER